MSNFEFQISNFEFQMAGDGVRPCFPIRNSKFEIRNSKPAFSLIELLVVISILALLMGIGVVAMRSMSQNAARNNTAAVLGQLAGALTEYQAQTKGNAPVPDGDINSFVRDVMRLGEDNPAERMLRTVDAEFWTGRYVYDTSSSNTIAVQDAWGNEIEYFNTDGDNGGSGVKEVKDQPVRPATGKRYFGSAGPDGLWGTFANGDPSAPDADAADNIYSFQTLK